MACLTTEKSSPLPQPTQKRCSLPGPMGSLNLYATHQQRRLSERGLMIYRPNKPDIDLIRDFTNPSKKTSSSFLSCNSDHHGQYYQQQRRHSTVINVMPSSSSSSGGGGGHSSSSSGPWPGAGYTTERRHSSIIPGSIPGSMTSAYCRDRDGFLGSGPSTSKGRNSNNQTMTPVPSIVMATNNNNNNNNSSQHQMKGNGPASSSTSSTTASSSSGCRKVRLRIHKNPGAKEKFVVLGPTNTSVSSSPESDDDKLNFLRHPQFDNRRFSDSATTVRPPSICITPDAAFGPRGVNRRRSRLMTKDSGIVCSTGDLLTLKCLTSSAYEIRSPSALGSATDDQDVGPSSSASLQSLGSRSRSFDATIVLARKGPGSSWFSRRHQPIAVKLPLPINSPTISSPGDTRYFPCSAAGILRTPILTITNENASKSELIEIPSPPAASPVSSRNSPEEKTKVAWDKNDGFVLDAAVLGIAIENHLRRVDMQRRATFSALYQPQPIFLESKVSSRARSASACVPLPVGMCGTGSGTDSPDLRSIFGCVAPGSGGRSTSGRKSSLTGGGAGGRLFSWDRGSNVSSSSSSGPGPSTSAAASSNTTAVPSTSSNIPVLIPTATTSISFTSSGSSSGQSTYETHIHRLPMSMGMTPGVYMNNLDSPSSDSFVNFRATEDDIEEENFDEDNYDGDNGGLRGIPEEQQAFLGNQQQQQRDRVASYDTPKRSGFVGKISSFASAHHSTTFSSSTSLPASSTSNSQGVPNSGRSNEGNQAGGGGGGPAGARHTSMSICSAIRDFILQSIRS